MLVLRRISRLQEAPKIAGYGDALVGEMQVHKVGTSERPDLPLAAIIGAGGMGMAVARRLGQSYRVLLVDRDEAALERHAATLRENGFDAQGARCDVTNIDDVAALVARAVESGPIRVVANVVGLSPSMGDFRTVMAVNLVGATRIATGFLPHLMPGACGIFISSMAGHLKALTTDIQALTDDPLAPGFIDRLEAVLDEPATSTLAYQLSKAALNRMCKRDARAWGAQGARIVSLSPGLIATPMGALEFERQPMKYDLLAATPLQREGTMLEIADVVEFLASDRASFISGTDILVDGGLTGTLQHGTGARPPS